MPFWRSRIPNVWRVRGEAGRVAARVRELVGGSDLRSADYSAPDELPPDPFEPDRVRPGFGHRLAAVIPVRVDPSRRATVTMGVAVLVAALLTGLWLVRSKPRPLAVSAQAPAGASAPVSVPPVSVGPGLSGAGQLPGTSPIDGGTAPSGLAVGAASATGVSGAGASPASAQVVVDVAGKVRRPGVYRLPVGDRVDDAIDAAGGARRGVDLSALNLAAVLVDGQQVLVGVAGGAVPVGAAPPTEEPSAAASIAPVSINTGTLEQLETLPRVGPVTAQKILDYRSAHGSFTSIDQLKDISGIGDVTYAGLAPLVTL
jgi:competence protein ComEA